MDQRQRVKLGIGGAILAFIAVVIWIIVLFFQDLGRSATLDILIAPSSAKVEINNQIYKTKKTYRFEPGEYVAEISAEGFQTKEENIALQAGETTKLYIYLIPEDGDMSWYAKHPEEDMILTSIGSWAAQDKSSTYLEAHPIANILPIEVVEVDPKTYDWTEYRIDGGQFAECKSDFCLKITDSTGGNRKNALEKIRAKGYQPEDYEIIYEYTPVKPVN